MNEAVEIATVAMQGYKAIGAGLSMLGAIGAGIGLGVYLGNYASAVSRNPGAVQELKKVLYIGIGVIEAIAIFATAIALLIIFYL